MSEIQPLTTDDLGVARAVLTHALEGSRRSLANSIEDEAEKEREFEEARDHRVLLVKRIASLEKILNSGDNGFE